MKVFLDTNVLASALATRGLCAELFESVLTGHELLASRGLLAELQRILTAKLRIPADTTAAFLTLIEANAPILPTPAEFPAGIPDPAPRGVLLECFALYLGIMTIGALAGAWFGNGISIGGYAASVVIPLLWVPLRGV